MHGAFDPAILAGFAAEVRGYLPKIEALLAEGPPSRALLEEAHRALHSIKGAGAMLGFEALARHAGAGEVILERALFLPASLDEAARARLAEVLDGLREALALLEQVTGALAEDPAEVGAAAAATGEAATDERRSEAHFPGGDLDPELRAIFAEEAREHLDAIAAQLGALGEPAGFGAALAQVRRSLHTLKGAAAMVGLPPIATLSHRLEDVLDHLGERAAPADRETREQLAEAIDHLEELVAGAPASERTERLLARLAARPAGRVAEAEAEEPGLAAETDATPAPGVAAPATLRVPVAGLDGLVRTVTELIVERSVVEQRHQELARQVGELKLAITRLRGVASRLEADYEVPALQQGGQAQPWMLPGASLRAGAGQQFDELELDRYTQFHQLSRALTETAGDLATLSTEIGTSSAQLEGSVVRLERLTTDVQEGLFGLRTLPLASLFPRLERACRRTARERGKQVEMRFEAQGVGVDKQVLDAIADPLLHLVRNAVDHGLESPESRRALGKPETGRIVLSARQEGPEVFVELADDGAGIDLDALIERASARGLGTIEALAARPPDELLQLVFEAGLSTADTVDELSGRGVGLDIVRTEVQALRGGVRVAGSSPAGTRFELRLPTQLALSRVLLVELVGQRFALPLAAVERVLRFEPTALLADAAGPTLALDGDAVPVLTVAQGLGLPSERALLAERAPAILMRAAGRRRVLLVERLLEAREVVVKGFGSLLPTLPGCAGTTILGDGSLVLILDPDHLASMTLVPGSSSSPTPAPAPVEPHWAAPGTLTALIVDDSLSVRKVLSNLVAAQGWKPLTARDGLEALELLGSVAELPDVMLLDIEMPRLDGYELLIALRAQGLLDRLPVVMLTSRAGDKHRSRAFELGASDYLVKPYHPEVLVATVLRLVQVAPGHRSFPLSGDAP
jgi:chemosensory pili system protein ChpA (sensor histidine kinase/response regulator)